MPILKRLQTYLDSHKIPYEVVSHSVAYSARRTAEALHVPGDMFAKVVIVKADQRFVTVVIPSTWRVDFKRLEEALDSRHVRLATEHELANLFPDCEVQWTPPSRHSCIEFKRITVYTQRNGAAPMFSFLLCF